MQQRLHGSLFNKPVNTCWCIPAHSLLQLKQPPPAAALHPPRSIERACSPHPTQALPPTQFPAQMPSINAALRLLGTDHTATPDSPPKINAEALSERTHLVPVLPWNVEAVARLQVSQQTGG